MSDADAQSSVYFKHYDRSNVCYLTENVTTVICALFSLIYREINPKNVNPFVKLRSHNVFLPTT